MKTHRTRLRLLVDVIYLRQGASLDDLRNQLHSVVQVAEGNGVISGDHDATVESLHAEVQTLEDK